MDLIYGASRMNPSTLSRRILAPGTLNAHNHSFQSMLRGRSITYAAEHDVDQVERLGLLVRGQVLQVLYQARDPRGACC